jgi:hypothetical protein
MFRFLAILSLVVGASALAAKPVVKAKVVAKPKAAAKPVMKSSFESEVGVLAPTGFWDPCGLSRNIDQDTFDQYRTAELKHGRVSQLAVLGYVVPEIFRFPGDIAPGVSFASIPSGIKVHD